MTTYSQIDKEIRDPKFNNKTYDSLMSIISNEKKCESLVNNAWYVWTNEDGSIGIEISTYIAKCLLNCPEKIFKKFFDNPNSYSKWIERIPENLLTDYSGNRFDELKKLKTQLLRQLDIYKKQTSLQKYNSIINELYNKIYSTKVEKVE